ncbi:hypothetical protein HELRODRAFT_162167 [Helobdella robusta]|uniref:Uncharacterized protein n=1 Tax=Helobdella robusta TaxID=6412 RepID=T1ESB2_HELRO|nr:hypothetical protein HELRODRAFT_162167 [Helobdella robusta]ESN98715.1 hypothetical protein HELRODRAFT_162167 [Helobdella robusta]
MSNTSSNFQNTLKPNFDGCGCHVVPGWAIALLVIICILIVLAIVIIVMIVMTWMKMKHRPSVSNQTPNGMEFGGKSYDDKRSQISPSSRALPQRSSIRFNDNPTTFPDASRKMNSLPPLDSTRKHSSRRIEDEINGSY